MLLGLCELGELLLLELLLVLTELLELLDRLLKLLLDWLELLDELLDVERLDVDDSLDVDWLLGLDTLDWLLKLELDTLDGDELPEDDELESSSIDKIRSRSPERGPGNSSSPVWKWIESTTDSRPTVSVSVNLATYSRLLGSSHVTVSTFPASSSSMTTVSLVSPL